MTILFLTSSFYPKIGGVETHSLEVAKKLSKKHKIIIVTQGEKDSREELGGIQIYRFYFGKQNWLKKFLIWRKLINKRNLFSKADIIHCHDVFFWYFPLRFIFPRKKVYVTFHGYETIYPPAFKSLFIRKLSEKLSRGNIIVGKYIEKWYGTKSDYIIYGGINKDKSKKIRPGKRTEKLKILYLGRIEEDNGVGIYSRVLENLKNFDFLAGGEGSLRKQFERHGKILGFVKNPEEYIKKSDIIFTSSYLSMLLGLLYKKPVFSVYQNSLKEDYLKMSPFSKYINFFSSDLKMARAIKKIKNNKKLLNIKTDAGYNWVKNETWDKVARIYLNLYGV